MPNRTGQHPEPESRKDSAATWQTFADGKIARGINKEKSLHNVMAACRGLKERLTWKTILQYEGHRVGTQPVEHTIAVTHHIKCV
jgi:hypothetical protein